MTLVDVDRAWFKSKVGLDVNQVPRNVSFCSHAILDEDPDIWVIKDTKADERFKASPLVVGAPYLRFYCAAPLTVNGQNLGELCIIDNRPRDDIPLEQLKFLKDLAHVITKLMVEKSIRAMEELSNPSHLCLGVLSVIHEPLLALTNHFKSLYSVYGAFKEQILSTTRSDYIGAVNRLKYLSSLYQMEMKRFENLLDMTLRVAIRIEVMQEKQSSYLGYLRFNIGGWINDLSDKLLIHCGASCKFEWELHRADESVKTNTSSSSQEELAQKLIYTHSDVMLLALIVICNTMGAIEMVSFDFAVEDTTSRLSSKPTTPTNHVQCTKSRSVSIVAKNSFSSCEPMISQSGYFIAYIKYRPDLLSSDPKGSRQRDLLAMQSLLRWVSGSLSIPHLPGSIKTSADKSLPGVPISPSAILDCQITMPCVIYDNK